MRGNVVDLAVGVVIGASFGKIVGSLVDDVFMPIIGRIFGGLDFTNYFFGLNEAARAATTYAAAKKAGATIGYGAFLTVAGNFIILPGGLFLVFHAMNSLTPRRKCRNSPPPLGRRGSRLGGRLSWPPRSAGRRPRPR